MKKQKTNQPTQKQLAEHMGFSQQRISTLLAAGMPRSLEAAERWLAENAERSIGGQSWRRQIKKQLDWAPPPMPSAGETKSEGLAGLRARTRATEHMTYGLLADAYERKEHGMLGILARSHALAVRGRVDAETQIAELERETGNIVPLQTATDTIVAALQPLMNQLHNFPRNVAALANPESPATAEKAIADGLNHIRSQISSQLERSGARGVPAQETQAAAG